MNRPDSSKRASTGAIIGAGAQGRITAVIWRRAAPTRTLVFLDDESSLWGTMLLDIPISGPIASLGRSDFGPASVIIAVGDNRRRTEIARNVQPYVAEFASVVDPSAAIMPHAEIGQGVFIGPQAVVQTGAHIGDHAIINTGAIVEHDSILETGVSLAPGARMGGRVQLEKHAFVGTGATVIGRIRIGEGAIVGAGSVVTRDVPAGCLVYGCPAKVVREATEVDWKRLL